MAMMVQFIIAGDGNHRALTLAEVLQRRQVAGRGDAERRLGPKLDQSSVEMLVAVAGLDSGGAHPIRGAGDLPCQWCMFDQAPDDNGLAWLHVGPDLHRKSGHPLEPVSLLRRLVHARNHSAQPGQRFNAVRRACEGLSTVDIGRDKLPDRAGPFAQSCSTLLR
jgi:hypothetical protein